MATVNILISDQPGGLFVKLTSDEPMPKDDEDSGSIAKVQVFCVWPSLTEKFDR